MVLENIRWISHTSCIQHDLSPHTLLERLLKLAYGKEALQSKTFGLQI